MAVTYSTAAEPAELVGTGEIIRKDGTVIPIVIHGRVAPQPEEKEQDNGE
jgi:hypothetical protein